MFSENKRTSDIVQSPLSLGQLASSEVGKLFDQFVDRPDVISESTGHRWRLGFQRHVDAAEVVDR